MNKVLVFSFLLGLVSCYTPKVTETKSENVSLNNRYEGDALEEIIKPYRDKVDAEMNEVIASADFDIIKYTPSSPLSNLVADIVFEKGMDILKESGEIYTKQNTFSLLNFGGLRAPINKGEITIGNVYELMPFDNSICVLTITPQKMDDFFAYMKEAEGQPVSNLFLDLSSDSANAEIGGESYDSNQNIHIITSDYLATGGDRMNFLKSPVKRKNLNVLIRDAIIEHLQLVKNLKESALSDQRIKLN